MKKYPFYCFLCFVFFLSSTLLSAQNFQLLLDPINSAQVTSLFNLSIINQSNYAGQLELQATLQSRRGKKLMIQRLMVSINSNEIKSIRGSSIEPQTLFKDAAFDQLYNEDTGLPPMNYVLCVQLLVFSDPPVRAEECIEYNATDFINLLPLYPNNKDVIYENRPIFNWIDLSNIQGCTYELKLVEHKPGTNANAALRRKLPIIHINDIPTNQLLFPADAQPLENNKSYAWQVSLNCQGEKIIATEPWYFTYKQQDSIVDIPRNLSYVDINELKNGATLFAVGEFKFKYSSIIETEIKAKLFENYKKEGKNKQLELTNDLFSVKRGINTFNLDLKQQVYLKHLKEYRIQLETKEGKNFRIFIEYVSPDYIKD